jgi:hypothetical protein
VSRGWNGNTKTVDERERDEPEEVDATVLPGPEAISLIASDPAPPEPSDDEAEEEHLH